MFALIALAVAAHLLVPGGQKTPQLPSSDAIKVAEAAAREWNYGRVDRRDHYFDINPPADGDDGYEKVLYYVDDRPSLVIAINLWTGQVIDPDRCIYFNDPYVRRFGEAVRSLTKRKPLTLKQLASPFDCVGLPPAGNGKMGLPQ